MLLQHLIHGGVQRITPLLTNEVVVVLEIALPLRNEVMVALTIRETGMTPLILVPVFLNAKKALIVVTGASEWNVALLSMASPMYRNTKVPARTNIILRVTI